MNVLPFHPQLVSCPLLNSQHSYAGPNSGERSSSPLPWGQSICFGSESPSPPSSPHAYFDGAEMHKFDDDEDMFSNRSKDSSFVFSIMEGKPSPPKPSGVFGLKKKFKAWDSGIVMSNNEGTSMGSINPSILSPAPKGAGQDFLTVTGC